MYKTNTGFNRGNREIKLQDVFLNYCRREHIIVEIQTLDNSVQRGRIIGFDSHAIILEENNKQHLVYKSAAVAVNPLSAVNHIFCDHNSRTTDIMKANGDELHGYSEYTTDFS